MDADQVREIVEIVEGLDLAGMIISNTTISRADLLTDKSELEAIGNGGLSGKPLRQKAQQTFDAASAAFNNKLPIIAVGGIHDEESAAQRIRNGASLIQIYTGFVYNGPGFVSSIKKNLKQ
jgi:dihydroorotate dehydrogenase